MKRPVPNTSSHVGVNAFYGEEVLDNLILVQPDCIMQWSVAYQIPCLRCEHKTKLLNVKILVKYLDILLWVSVQSDENLHFYGTSKTSKI